MNEEEARLEPPLEMAIRVPSSVHDARTELLHIPEQAHRELDLSLIAAVWRRHVRPENPGGLAKALLARARARLLGVGFTRVQFTPDATPGRITGGNLSRSGETNLQASSGSEPGADRR